jgi:hypothetical protein
VNFKWRLSRGARIMGQGHAPEEYSAGRQSCGEVFSPRFAMVSF